MELEKNSERVSKTYGYSFELVEGRRFADITFENDKFVGCTFDLKGHYSRDGWKVLGLLAAEVERLCKLHDESFLKRELPLAISNAAKLAAG